MTRDAAEGRPVAPEFVLREWEVWHTYTTFFEAPPPALGDAARRLVANHVADAVLLHDGAVWWHDDGAVRQARVEIGVGPTVQRADVRVPDALSGYAFEGVYLAAWLRFGEMMLFGSGAPLPPPYLRALLQPCLLTADDCRLMVYPVLKLYESGVASVALRMIGPPRAVRLRQFITRFVNAPLRAYSETLVPPAIARLAPSADRAWAPERALVRARAARRQSLHERAIDERIRRVEAGPFTFDLAPLASAPDQRGGTLADLALCIMTVAWFAAHGPRDGWTRALLGQRVVPSSGPFWTGRPHVHVLRFRDQGETADANESRHQDAFGAILGRTVPTRVGDTARYLPPNARPLGDMGVYVNEAGTLWVQAKRGLRASAGVPWADANRGHLIYEHHAKVEMMEHGYAVHRELLERVRSRRVSVGEALAAQRALLDLELVMAEASRFGEIRELLSTAWRAWGVDRLRDVSTRLLAVRQAEAAHHHGDRAARSSTYLAAVAALLAAPALATLFVKPIWEARGWWPVGRPYADAAYALVATAAAAALLWVGHRIVARPRGGGPFERATTTE